MGVFFGRSEKWDSRCGVEGGQAIRLEPLCIKGWWATEDATHYWY